MTFKVNENYIESRRTILALVEHNEYEISDFDHIMKYECGGRHCKRNSRNHRDIYSAYWAMLNDGAIALKYDDDKIRYVVKKGEYYDFWVDLESKRDPETGMFPTNK